MLEYILFAYYMVYKMEYYGHSLFTKNNSDSSRLFVLL